MPRLLKFKVLTTLFSVALSLIISSAVFAGAVRPALPPIPHSPAPEITYLSVPPRSSVAVIFDLSYLSGADNGQLLSIKHTLDAFGIPYFVTRDLETALDAHEMLFVAGSLDKAGNKLLGHLRRGLASWASERGHTLWISGLKDKELLESFNLKLRSSSSLRTKIRMTAAHHLNTYVNTPEEQEIWLAKIKKSPLQYVETLGYEKKSSRHAYWQIDTVASYMEDGQSAMVMARQNHSGSRVIILGVTFSDLLIRLENELNNYSTRGGSNVFDPSADIVRLMMRSSYEQWTRKPYIRPFAPEGKKAAVLLTHDIDATSAFAPLRDTFIPLEEMYGITSTLFVTTSYRSNHFISGFYAKPENKAILAQALAKGFDIESHSVSHLLDMENWPIGDPINNPALYAPNWNSKTETTTGGMVLPEMLISEKLLTDDLGANVRGWRSGDLLKPKYEGALLEATGYVYESNHVAGRTGGSFPYLMMADYDTSGEEVRVLEFPIAISDSGISTRTSEQTAQMWLDVAYKNVANNAPTVILVHPTRPDEKRPPYEIFLKKVMGDRDLWVGSLEQYYEWYRQQGIRSELTEQEYYSTLRDRHHSDHDDDDEREHGGGHR